MKNNLMLVGRVNNPINTINVGKTIINNPPVIAIFIGGIFTIPSHGWQKWHCFAHIIYIYIYIKTHSPTIFLKRCRTDFVKRKNDERN